jgi:hypothetical protein
MKDEKQKLFLEALSNRVEQDKRQRIEKYLAKKDKDLSKNLAKGSLDKEKLKVKSSGVEDLTPERISVGKTEKIDKIGDVVPKTEIKDFSDKMKNLSLTQDLKATMKDAINRGDDDMINKLKAVGKKLSKGATKGLRAFPLIGGVLGAISSGDASAAVPGLGDVDSVGMSPEQEDMFLAEQKAKNNYMKSQAYKNRLNALKKLSNK